MGLELIDGTLHLLGENDEVLHVFERARGTLGPAAYKHMCVWAIANFNSKFEGDPETFWTEAENSWNDLTPETQGLLLALQVREEQMISDIRTGLLATLSDYQGIKSIKDRFAEAIRSVE